jgi:hypothetical protein
VALRGAPLLSVGQEETRGATCFLVEAGRIVVLRRPDFEQPLRRAARAARRAATPRLVKIAGRVACASAEQDHRLIRDGTLA